MVELGGHPMVLRATSCSSRAASRCATPRSCSPATSPRSASAPATRTAARPRRARHGAGGEHALAAPPPVPGARRPDDAARGVRLDRGPRADLRRRRQQRRPLARAGGGLAGVEVRVAAPAGLPARARRGAELFDDPARRPAAPTPSTPTSGCRWATTRRGRRSARGARAVPARRGAARARGAARDRPALPARAPRRGDHPRASTATASGSGTRPRTAATRRRRCSSCSSSSVVNPVDSRQRWRSIRGSGRRSWSRRTVWGCCSRRRSKARMSASSSTDGAVRARGAVLLGPSVRRTSARRDPAISRWSGEVQDKARCAASDFWIAGVLWVEELSSTTWTSSSRCNVAVDRLAGNLLELDRRDDAAGRPA